MKGSVKPFREHHRSTATASGTDISACEKATSDGRVGDDLDAELARGLQHRILFVLDVEGERRVLDLDRRDGVHGVCTAESRRRDLRQAEVLHFPGPGRRSMLEL